MQTRESSDRTREFQTPAPHVSRYVEANGLKLHYLDYGTEGRPPMLCVHGGAAHAHWYDYVAPGFTADHHVLSLDLRGHGRSAWVEPSAYTYQDYASDLNAAVEKLDLRDFVLIGHSMGGTVCLTYAASHPGRVKALIIVDTMVNLTAERIGRLRDIGSRSGSHYATQEELISRYKLRPGESLATPEVVRYIATHSGRQYDDGMWRHNFDRNVYATREMFDGMELWHQIRIPSLLVKGSLSDRISPEVFAMVASRTPRAEMVEVSGSGHHVTLDNPAEFVDKVNPFLARCR